MDTFMKIKELASKLTRDCFTKDQYIIITGVDCNTDKMFSYTLGDFFGVIATIAAYIESLEKIYNPLEMSKYDILELIRISYEEDDKYDQTS